METQRRDRLALAAVVFTVLFAQVLLYPGVPQLVASLGGSGPLDAGTWFLAAEFAGFVLFAGVWGALSDAAGGRRRFIAIGAVGGGVAYAVLAALPAVPFAAVLAVRFVEGAFTIGAFSLAIATLMDLGGGNGRNMGAAGIAIGLGTGLGAPLGGQLYGLGPRVPLAVAAVLMFVVGVAALRLRDPERAAGGARPGPLDALRTVRERPALGVPFAFGFADRFTAGFFALVGVAYFQSEFGLGPAETGLLLGAFFLPFALLQYPLGALSDRVGRVGPVAAGSFAYGVVIVGVSFAPTPALAAVVMALVGAFGALCAPATLALVNDLADAEGRGTATGGFNVVGSLGFLAGVVGGGLLADRLGYATAFLVAGGAEIALALVLLPALLRIDVERVATFAGED
ncbi:MFS transporter [Halosegnis marinus]|uniref:MFS transporter n=1 Tax=Halosegnis marinus TaxID=3034023 RepID=A0ABD5ZNM4_9EURY|nr:MFS transporter [Halosegnis sp. DT85]